MTTMTTNKMNISNKYIILPAVDMLEVSIIWIVVTRL